jgi:hypothetical protein
MHEFCMHQHLIDLVVLASEVPCICCHRWIYMDDSTSDLYQRMMTLYLLPQSYLDGSNLSGPAWGAKMVHRNEPEVKNYPPR